MLWLFHICCSDAPIACLLFNLVRNSVVHSTFSVIRDPRYGNVSTCSSCSFWMSKRHSIPSLAITLVLSTLMSRPRLYLRLTRFRRPTNSCSSALEVANRKMSSAEQRFVTIRPPICSPLWNPSRVSLMTISAKMLNKYRERTHLCRTPFLTWNYSDSVPATLILASCFLWSLASKSISCRGYPLFIIVTQSLS